MCRIPCGDEAVRARVDFGVQLGGAIQSHRKSEGGSLNSVLGSFQRCQLLQRGASSRGRFLVQKSCRSADLGSSLRDSLLVQQLCKNEPPSTIPITRPRSAPSLPPSCSARAAIGRHGCRAVCSILRDDLRISCNQRFRRPDHLRGQAFGKSKSSDPKVMVPDGDWSHSRLGDVCEALDKEKIPIPKKWKGRNWDAVSLAAPHAIQRLRCCGHDRNESGTEKNRNPWHHVFI